jgi:hypothetical protein
MDKKLLDESPLLCSLRVQVPSDLASQDRLVALSVLLFQLKQTQRVNLFSHQVASCPLPGMAPILGG